MKGGTEAPSTLLACCNSSHHIYNSGDQKLRSHAHQHCDRQDESYCSVTSHCSWSSLFRLKLGLSYSLVSENPEYKQPITSDLQMFDCVMKVKVALNQITARSHCGLQSVFVHVNTASHQEQLLYSKCNRLQ